MKTVSLPHVKIKTIKNLKRRIRKVNICLISQMTPVKKNVSISFQTTSVFVFWCRTTATAKSLQLCPTLCDPIPGILQARTLEWVAISFSNA